MAKNRKAAAVWTGGLKDGKGTLSTESNVLKNTMYNFSGRFEAGTGTNPEELIAAAQAGCYAMALSADLGDAGFKPSVISASASVTLDDVGGKPTITAIHVDVRANVPGITREKFNKIAEATKSGCPVSRVLNAPITLSTTLE